MVKDNRNCIAIKLNYCDGGIEKYNIGYCGICSKELINYNINIVERSACSRSYCKDYLDNVITYDELRNYWSPKYNGSYICSESRIFRDWSVTIGFDSSGKPRHFSNIDDLIGKLCILTTVFPNYKGIDRFVIAMFIINNVDDGRNINYCDKVISDKKYRLRFNKNEAQTLKYWEIQKSNKDGSKSWGNGLFRYFDNEDAIKFIKKAVEIKTGTSEENFAKEFLNHYCKINNIKNVD